MAELTSLLINWMWVVTEGKEPPRFVAWGTGGDVVPLTAMGKMGVGARYLEQTNSATLSDNSSPLH